MPALALIPAWLGVVCAGIFAAVLVAHLRHIWVNCPVSRRCWHWGHVLMAVAMIAMYLPPSLEPLIIPDAAWRAGFILALGVLAAGGITESLEHRAVSGLWLLVAGDLVAMLYMWSPGLLRVPLSVALGIFLVLEAALWASDRALTLDRALVLSPGALASSGGLLLGSASGSGSISGAGVGAGAGAVGASWELRVAMVAMSLGMAYMILAMALAG